MMGTTPPVFTVARIAELLGVDRKTIREQLAGEGAGDPCSITVKGQVAQAWTVDRLPPALFQRVDTAARSLGFNSAEAFLAKGRVRWHPAMPVGKIAPQFVDRAKKRAAILAPVIRANRTAPIAALVEAAATDWARKHGGSESSARTVRRWIERAIERDRGYEDWDRWMLYLDDELAAAPVDAAGAAHIFDLPRLECAISALADPARLSASDRESIWLQCMIEADAIAAQHSEELAQKTILAALRNACLPLSRDMQDALRVTYRRKRDQWFNNGQTPSAVQDKRRDRNAERRWTLPLTDKLTILRYYRNSHDLSSAWRMARKNRALSSETNGRFKDDPADKSYVPHTIREALATDIELIDMRKVGPRAAKLAGGWIERDHSGYEPGDWWQGDDLTPPVYYWEESSEGPVIMRGQILAMVDVRTTFILGWMLISARGYTARQIRSLITRCHDEHGLPRNGFYFERGLWERSRVLKGHQDSSAVSFDETELGLREFGLHFEHANTPRAKVIERVFGAVQNRMEHLPGYCGRDERRDCPEKTRKAILEVNAGRCHPREHFMSKEEWAAEIAQIVDAYNSEQHSTRAKLIPGMSPAEAYAKRKTGDIIRLSVETRHLLAKHRLVRRVSRQGIRLPSGLGGGLYRGEATGSIISREVFAWVDPENLETITITDLDRKNPRIVERADQLPAFAEHPDQIRTATRQLAAHNRYGAELFRVVSCGDKPAGYRAVVVDRETAAVGAEMQRQAEQRKTEAQNIKRNRAEVTREASQLGVVVPAVQNQTQLADQADALRKVREALREGERESHE